MVAGLLAFIAAALFMGAAFYINFAEQPAAPKAAGTAMGTRRRRRSSGAATSRSSSAIARCTLKPGQRCVVPIGAEHRGSTKGGAEVVLLTTLAS